MRTQDYTTWFNSFEGQALPLMSNRMKKRLDDKTIHCKSIAEKRAAFFTVMAENETLNARMDKRIKERDTKQKEAISRMVGQFLDKLLSKRGAE